MRIKFVFVLYSKFIGKQGVLASFVHVTVQSDRGLDFLPRVQVASPGVSVSSFPKQQLVIEPNVNVALVRIKLTRICVSYNPPESFGKGGIYIMVR